MAPYKIDTDSTAYGSATVAGLLKEEKQAKKTTTVSKQHDIVLKNFRLLVADLCQQFGGGHPGYVLGPNHPRLQVLT